MTPPAEQLPAHRRGARYRDRHGADRRTYRRSADHPYRSQRCLPTVKAAGRVQVREIRIAPSQPAELHVHNGRCRKHPGRSVLFQIDGQPATVLRARDVLYEAEDKPIARFDAQQDGVTFLA